MGTNMTVSVNHAGAFSALSALNNQTYTYGNTTPYTVPGWGSLTISSPAPAPGLDNAMKIDFTLFNYSAFIGQFDTVGTAKIQNLAENFDLASVRILVSGLDMRAANARVLDDGRAVWNHAGVDGFADADG